MKFISPTRSLKAALRFGSKMVLAASLLLSSSAFAAGVEVKLDSFPTTKLTDQAALQNGAKLFVNYCLGCHGLSQVRYNKLRELGLNEEQIKSNLILTSAKFGDPIMTTLNLKDAAQWFGKAPPDLSLTARSRSGPSGTGADWIYTYLRSYYLDPARPTGWNNLTYPAVGMPHVLWELQGQNEASYKTVKDHGHEVQVFDKFVQKTKGTLSSAEYDNTVADLTAFLAWAAEPAALSRKQIGVWVLLFLAVFFVFAWRLNAAYWKDIK